jgi:hypothetical protein
MTLKKRLIAVFPISTKVGKFIGDLQAFIESLTTTPGNTKVTIPAGDITTINGHIGDLVSAQATAQSREDGTAADRDIALEVCKKDARDLERIVQAAADAAPDAVEALAIIQACGLRARSRGVLLKPDLAAKMDPNVSGLVKLSSKAADQGVRASYEWQYSANGVSFTTIKTTTVSRTTWISGLAPGTKAYFRKRVITADIPGGPAWSQVVFVWIV